VLVEFSKNSGKIRDLNLMKEKMQILLFTIIVGCTTTKSPTDERHKLARYKTGDCLMLVDPSHGVFSSRHRVRIEKVEQDLRKYSYRWLLDNGKWDSELSYGVGNFDVLEKITVKAYDCPK
jgi:hypothetical protein